MDLVNKSTGEKKKTDRLMNKSKTSGKIRVETHIMVMRSTNRIVEAKTKGKMQRSVVT